MRSPVAELFATAAVWAAAACIFIFGLCKMNWTGSEANFGFIAVSALTLAAATASTFAVWRRRSA